MLVALAGGWRGIPVEAAVPTAIDAKNVNFDVRAMDIVYDPLREVIYAVTDGTDPTYPNRIISIDPDTAEVTSALTLAASPTRIAIAGDSSAVYVATSNEVIKYALPSFALEWSFSAGTATVFDVSVAPSPDTIAVSIRGISGSGTYIVDHGVARPSATDSSDTGYTVFDPSGTRLYLMTSSLVTYDVDASGLTARREWGSITRGRISIVNGMLAGDTGLLDITGGAPAPAVDLSSLGVARVVHDPVRRELIGTARSSRNTPGSDLVVMDDTTYAVKEVWDATSSGNGWVTERMVWAGQGRVAFRDTPYMAEATGVVLVWFDPDAGFGSEGEYHPLDPERFLDTRSGLGLPDGSPRRVGPGETIEVQLAGRGALPPRHVAAVVMNVTAVDPSAVSFLTVYPGDIDRPTISNLNLRPGVTVANLVTVPVSATGSVSIYNPFGSVDVLADVAGFYSTDAGRDGLRFRSYADFDASQRILDTRTVAGAALGPQTTAIFSAADRNGFFHPDTKAVVLNVTITNSTAASFVTVAPADVSRPTVSNLNFGPGNTIANQVVVRVPPDGRLQLYNEAGTVDVVVDLVGVYSEQEIGERGRFVAFEPFRAVDTRAESPYPPPGRLWSDDVLYVGDGVVRASAYVVNVTVTDTVGQGFVTAFPHDPTRSLRLPLASTVNYTSGNTVPNHAVVTPGPYLGFYHFGGEAHLVVDVFGAFTLL